MLEEVKNLLAALGVSVPEGDSALRLICDSVAEQIKNETNQDAVPEGLHHAAVEMAAGKCLCWLRDAGQLEASGFDLDAAVKQIQEGDTSIAFAVGEGSATPEQRLAELIGHLVDGRRREFARYRRLEW